MEDKSIRPSSVKYGLIYGAASVLYALLIYSTNLVTNPAISVLSIAIGVGAVFLAIREYKQLNDGYLRLKQGISIGILVILIGGIISSIFTFIYASLIKPTFKEDLIATLEQQMRESASQQPEVIDMTLKMYDVMFSPGVMLITGLISAVISGLIYGLIIGAIMKNDRPIMDE